MIGIVRIGLAGVSGPSILEACAGALDASAADASLSEASVSAVLGRVSADITVYEKGAAPSIYHASPARAQGPAKAELYSSASAVRY